MASVSESHHQAETSETSNPPSLLFAVTQQQAIRVCRDYQKRAAGYAMAALPCPCTQAIGLSHSSGLVPGILRFLELFALGCFRTFSAASKNMGRYSEAARTAAEGNAPWRFCRKTAICPPNVSSLVFGAHPRRTPKVTSDNEENARRRYPRIEFCSVAGDDRCQKDRSPSAANRETRYCSGAKVAAIASMSLSASEPSSERSAI